MINKKTTKHKNQKKVNSVIVEKNKKLSTRGRRRSKNESSISGTKQSKIDTKKESNHKKAKDKKSDKSSVNVRSLRLSDKKDTHNGYNSKSNKSSKVTNIKEIVKKVKNKANKTCNDIKEVVKRELRNNCKISFDFEKQEIKMKNNAKSTSDRNKNAKQKSDTIVLNHDNEKLNPKNSSKYNSKSNLCSKLFPTLNCVKSTNSSKTCNKLEKQQNLDSKINGKTNLKENKPLIAMKEKLTKKSTNNKKKTKPKTKSNNKIRKSFNIKKKSNSSSKQMKKTVKKETKKPKKTIKNKKTKLKKESKTGKSLEKEGKGMRNNPIVRRGHRVASLNAIAKVRLLCENESERHDVSEEDSFTKLKSKPECKSDKKCKNKDKNEVKVKKENKCRALVPVDNSSKQLAVRKRKNIDNAIEIIDTRSCKRMASLNASAIMAASYSPERFRRSKSIESIHSNSSVEMIREMQTISQTVSHFEISPGVNGINGVHVNQNNVIFKSQKHETIKTVKQLKVSNKIKDRLLGIAKLERQEERAKHRRKGSKNETNADDNLSIGSDDQSLVSGAGVSEFQATKVQVTKVTHINTSQGKDKKKSGHQIDSILERDSAVVHKYQVQTKSTIEMQTTFNSTNGSSIANVTTITAPQQTPTTGSVPRMHVHLSGAPTQPFAPPMLPSTNSGHPTPTYFNFAGAAPVLQVHNNQYQAISSAPTINQMPIINLSEPYPTHYSSAFSVPHFATHTHPAAPTPFNYFHAGIYQPAGPLLQPFQDPCLIHKPIPFHPPNSQINHIHSSPQFSNPNLGTQNTQTFPSELTQAFHSNGQYFHQLATPLRPPQTLFFQALPHNSASMAPNATTFTLLNPGVHYTHPTFVSSEHLTTNETPTHIVTNDMNYLNRNSHPIVNTNTTNSSVEQISNDNTSRQQISKSIQCSPQSRDSFQTLPENPFCDSTDSLVRMSHMVDKASVTAPHEPQNSCNKRTNKSDHRSEKRKKSLLLKHTSNRNNDEVIVRDNNTQTLTTECEPLVEQSSSAKSITPSNQNKLNSINKVNSQLKTMKAVCVQMNTSLPSASMPSVPSMPSTPSPLNRLLPLKRPNRKRNSHGWSWEGKAVDKYVYLNNEEQSYLRKCFPAIRHNEGDVIRVRDCVLLRSGPRKTDLPFVAKIAALWETPEGEMMMSLLWYYRPEHTDLEYYSNQMLTEIFASKHRDVNSVACIDDKCYVLTYNEFCRYKRLKLLKQSALSTCLTSNTVPPLDESYPRMDRMPPTRVFPELVFCCRKVYDYRQKRILKNPI